MEFTSRELALMMVALDITAYTIQQSIDMGDCDGYEESWPSEMQKLWDRIHDQYNHQHRQQVDSA